MPEITKIELCNKLVVAVPDNPSLLTHYILQEQLDWFEDEITFVRNFFLPGMQALDVGANYGLYSLSIAQKLDSNGSVWAFEPTPLTANCLRTSIALNNFSNVELLETGLSNKSGSATFYVSKNSEFNSLHKPSGADLMTVEISLQTLDLLAENYNWKNIDFIKLDAEGEELNILAGGAKLLEESSPLIMYELKHGGSVNKALIHKFEEMGYKSYRLIRSLDVLVPFDYSQEFDPFLLNLFCCKSDTTNTLKERSIMVDSALGIEVLKGDEAHSYCSGLSYYQLLQLGNWKDDDLYHRALDAYVYSQNKSNDINVRVACLAYAMQVLRDMVGSGEQCPLKLATTARVAIDAGERHYGATILSKMLNIKTVDVDQQSACFLPASKRFDTVEPVNGNIDEWFIASILEAYVLNNAYSSYFGPKVNLELLNMLSSTPYFNDELLRRKNKIIEVFGAQLV